MPFTFASSPLSESLEQASNKPPLTKIQVYHDPPSPVLPTFSIDALTLGFTKSPTKLSGATTKFF